MALVLEGEGEVGGGLDVLAQLGQTQPRRVVCLRVGAVDGEAVACMCHL